MTRKKEINASQPATTRIATPLADLIDARLSRRSALKGLFAGGAAMVVAPVARAATQSVDPSSLGFAQAPHKIEMYHQAAPGHRADVLIRWGDKVLRDAAEFDPFKLSAEAQEKQFGYNNDFVAFLDVQFFNFQDIPFADTILFTTSTDNSVHSDAPPSFQDSPNTVLLPEFLEPLRAVVLKLASAL